MKFRNLIELQAYFSNELICAQYLEQMRWNGMPECPHCGSEHHYRTKTRLKHPELKDYKDFYCKACMKKYTVLTGTVYESSKVSIKLWLSALYILCAHKKGISSIQLGKDIGVSQKTAWFMLHRLRAMMKEEIEILEGEVSVDETFIGGKNKNRHKDKKARGSQGRAFVDKTPVMGLLQKGGRLICQVIPNTSSQTLQTMIFQYVKLKSWLYTDDWLGYSGLSIWYKQSVIDHARKKYANGKATTNNIEGVWTHLKKCLHGIYHTVSRYHLQSYCDEFTFRWNHRDITDPEKFALALQQINGKRILYKRLINNSIT